LRLIQDRQQRRIQAKRREREEDQPCVRLLRKRIE
jgi:hypothetical protein